MQAKRRGLSCAPRIRRRRAALLAAVALLTLLVGVVAAQSSGGCDLSTYSLDNGSGILTGAQHALAGTLAEPFTGLSIGDKYALRSGFDPGFPVAEARPPDLYLPLLLGR